MNRTISTVEIRNFQSHKKTVLNLDPGINLITGTSNSGKSAINRAINWALTNKPMGDYFIRKGCAYASVKLIFSDGSSLHRFRGAESNFVEITRHDGKVKRCEKFGAEYPQIVKKFLSIPKDNEIIGNLFYSDQMNNLFLVNLSKADLPRAIGYLAGSDSMESATRNMQQKSRQIKRDVACLKKEITDLKKELSKFDHVDDDLSRLSKMKTLYDDITSKQIACDEIISFQDGHMSLNDAISRINSRLAQLKGTQDGIVLLGNIKSMLKDYDDMKMFSRSYDEFNNSNKDVTHRSKTLAVFFKSYKKTQLDALKLTINNWSQISQFSDEYDALKSSVLNEEKLLDDLNENALKINKEIKKNKEILIKNEYVCTACGQKLS